jgi:hypothetical protein
MATAIENLERVDFDALASQLKASPVDSSTNELGKNSDQAQVEQPESRQERSARTVSVKKGEKSWDVDEDALIEVMADKEPVTLTMRELKERASGDIAIKKRMHSLAEEKKKVQGTMKEFATLAKKDPLRALEFISNKAKESDSEFAYDKYIEALADQAKRVSEMSDVEKRTYEAEKKLETVESDLTQKERELLVEEKRLDIIDLTGVTEDVFDRAFDTVLESPDLMEGAETEIDVLNRVQDFLIEVESQKVAYNCIKDIDPSAAADKQLVFLLSDVIQENEDFNEEDIREIVRGVVGVNVRKSDNQLLSNRQRQEMNVDDLRAQGSSEYQLLVAQLQEDKSKRKR